jgi:hypothetical protein
MRSRVSFLSLPRPDLRRTSGLAEKVFDRLNKIMWVASHVQNGVRQFRAVNCSIIEHQNSYTAIDSLKSFCNLISVHRRDTMSQDDDLRHLVLDCVQGIFDRGSGDYIKSRASKQTVANV